MSPDPKGLDAFVAEREPGDLPSDFRSSSSIVCLAAPGTPVIYVSEAFEAHTGYRPADVVGRNLSLLQGPDTEPEAVARFRDLIERCEAGTIRITNYRRDGTPFAHRCELRPVAKDDGTVTHFIAVQRPEEPR